MIAVSSWTMVSQAESGNLIMRFVVVWKSSSMTYPVAVFTATVTVLVVNETFVIVIVVGASVEDVPIGYVGGTVDGAAVGRVTISLN